MHLKCILSDACISPSMSYNISGTGYIALGALIPIILFLFHQRPCLPLIARIILIHLKNPKSSTITNSIILLDKKKIIYYA